MGTAFLAPPPGVGIGLGHRAAALARPTLRKTRITRSFSGPPGAGHRNAMMARAAAVG